MEKPSWDYLKSLVRHQYTNAIDFDHQLINAGYIKYSDFLKSVKEQLGLKRTEVERILVEQQYLSPIVCPRYSQDFKMYEYWNPKDKAHSKIEYIPTTMCLRREYMEYRMPTVTGQPPQVPLPWRRQEDTSVPHPQRLGTGIAPHRCRPAREQPDSRRHPHPQGFATLHGI